jgi:hypothetical protein
LLLSIGLSLDAAVVDRSSLPSDATIDFSAVSQSPCCRTIWSILLYDTIDLVADVANVNQSHGYQSTLLPSIDLTLAAAAAAGQSLLYRSISLVVDRSIS